ncbi:MAG: Rieske (2Fe-2S) protein [Gemmatimonadaceae bacterium]|nr:Rieske (2Fe-2S) protein [Gemmatimonadaceae bacterium]MDQ3242707.1 Rieske (2Fe-2S) protein [Gemmatimonadota bacterium]
MPLPTVISPFEPVARLHEIPEEGVLGVMKENGDRICLIRHRNRVSAMANNCTHQDFEMSLGDVLSDGTLQCAWHGARFDCTTGEVRQGPAADPIRMYEVTLEDGQVLVGPAVTSPVTVNDVGRRGPGDTRAPPGGGGAL